jgi:hypothetical protein
LWHSTEKPLILQGLLKFQMKSSGHVETSEAVTSQEDALMSLSCAREGFGARGPLFDSHSIGATRNVLAARRVYLG